MSLWRQDTQVFAPYLQSPQLAKNDYPPNPSFRRGLLSGFYPGDPHCPSFRLYGLSLGNHIQKKSLLCLPSLFREERLLLPALWQETASSQIFPSPKNSRENPKATPGARLPTLPGRDRKEACLENNRFHPHPMILIQMLQIGTWEVSGSKWYVYQCKLLWGFCCSVLFSSVRVSKQSCLAWNLLLLTRPASNVQLWVLSSLLPGCWDFRWSPPLRVRKFHFKYCSCPQQRFRAGLFAEKH